MRRHLRPALTLLLFFSLLTGVLYPLAVTGLAQLLWPQQAAGSLLIEQGQVRGSTLIGQRFTQPGYFHGRPSSAGAGYDASASGGSNLGPTSALLQTRLAERLVTQQRDNPGLPVPPELLYGSASGLDPHLSPAAVAFQLPRVAAARGIDTATLQALVAQHTRPRLLGVLGEPVVNLLLLNQALDALQSRPAAGLQSRQ